MIPFRQFRSEVRPMLRLALPLIVAEIGWILMNFVDLAMIGRSGATSIAAVSVGNAVFIAFAIIGEGILLGLDSLVSQHFGAGRLDACHRTLFAALQLCLPIAAIMMVCIRLGALILPRIGIPTDVCAQAGPFLDAISWSMVPLLAFFALRRYLQGMHLVRIIPFALVSANLVNFAFNYALIYGHFGFPALGAEGSGWSTTIARVYMFVVLAVYTLWQDKRRGFHLSRYAREFHPQVIRDILRLGAPAAAQIALEVGVFSASTLIAGELGPVAVSGHQIALSMASFTFMVPLGMSSATAVRVGHAIGRRDPEAANVSGWTGVALSAMFMSCAAVVFWTLPHILASIFTNDPQIIAVAVSLLSIAAIFQFFDGVQVTAIGALRGSGDTHTAMLTNILGWWIIGLPLGVWLCFHQGWGVKGIWAGLCTGLVLIGCILAVAWRRRVHQLERVRPTEASAQIRQTASE